MGQIEIMQGDITELKVDAIVNAANTSLLGGGGVDGAIHRKAGPGLLEECRKLNGCAAGEAKITGGYKLLAAHVINTPGPIYRDGKSNESVILKNCYINSMQRAMEAGCQSIAFPAISTGIYGYPIREAAEIAFSAVTEFLKAHPGCGIKQVIFVCFSSRDLHIYEEIKRLTK